MPLAERSLVQLVQAARALGRGMDESAIQSTKRVLEGDKHYNERGMLVGLAAQATSRLQMLDDVVIIDVLTKGVAAIEQNAQKPIDRNAYTQLVAGIHEFPRSFDHDVVRAIGRVFVDAENTNPRALFLGLAASEALKLGFTVEDTERILEIGEKGFREFATRDTV